MDFQKFVTESNRIEGILRPPTEGEMESTRRFVCGAKPTLIALIGLASEYTDGHGHLRERVGMDVRVGNHFPPKGGPAIARRLEELLSTIEDADPFEFHLAYETLHPFMDGNGRTGRALWAWQMWQSMATEYLDLGFLHSFYYQTLSAQRKDFRREE